ncbi:MAG: hypothetical protein J6C19_16130 [Lachnospiraceae bacterium]|nr:hypothetical protein [Lachnospiraceae bacterium]MBO5147028.1 hypothetical protein [Lachnospiraceae bacterium]
MSTLEKAIDLLQRMPENKVDTVYTYMCFVDAQMENNDIVQISNQEINNSLLSEPSLSKDWLRDEEDRAWQNL